MLIKIANEAIDKYFQFIPGDIVLTKELNAIYEHKSVLIITKSEKIIDGCGFNWRESFPNRKEYYDYPWMYAGEYMKGFPSVKHAWWNNEEFEKILYLNPLRDKKIIKDLKCQLK